MNLYIKDTQNKGLFAQAQFSQVLKNVKKLSIVAVKPDTPISKALELMTENKIFTLAMQSRSNPNKFMAIFSTSDFLDYILLKMNKTLSDPSLAQTILKESVENLLSLDPEDESYRIWERDYRDTIERTVIAFGQGIHRAMITDALNTIPPAILTQTDLIRFALASQSTSLFSVDWKASISESLKSCFRPVVSMTTKDSALQGYERIQAKSVAALPILDNKGVLVSTLSKEDLRGLTVERIMKLNDPVLEFVQSKKSLVTCVGSDSLLKVVQSMVDAKVHRVWIVSSQEERKVQGVISQSDILAALVGVDQCVKKPL